MRLIAICSCIGVLVAMLLVFSVVTVRYRITKRHLVISWLGIPLRWVRLSNILQVTPQRLFWAEKWFNSLQPGNRYLNIEKKSALIFKHLIVTPKNHMVFKAELDRARGVLPLPSTDNGSDAPPRVEKAWITPPPSSTAQRAVG